MTWNKAEPYMQTVPRCAPPSALLCLFSTLHHLQLERVLGSEQRRSDFTPRDDALSFDRPTSACLLGTALLAALGAAAKGALGGNNLRLFLAEVRTVPNSASTSVHNMFVCLLDSELDSV